MNLGAIDIGSNAARVLIKSVTEEENGRVEFTKQKLLRYPIRLGMDAFVKGKISETKADKLVKMCTVFKLLMELYEVEDFRAYATSAMRDAENGEELADRVARETGIEIHIIDGMAEATILYHTHFEEAMNKSRNYIYVDVGGGSTEISLFVKGILSKSESFRVGTIRMMHQLTGDKELMEIRNWVQQQTSDHSFFGIGSGGNINTMFSLSGKLPDDSISLDYLQQHLDKFSQLSVRELMKTYDFKEDRADVIVNALKIYTTVFSAADVNEIYVPKIGLADGMIQLLSQDYFQS